MYVSLGPQVLTLDREGKVGSEARKVLFIQVWHLRPLPLIEKER